MNVPLRRRIDHRSQNEVDEQEWPMGYIVEYVELESGKKPFEEFVLSLPIYERAQVFETVNYFIGLRNQNLPIKGNFSKHLEDGIFELRTAFAKKIAREIIQALESEKPAQELHMGGV